MATYTVTTNLDEGANTTGSLADDIADGDGLSLREAMHWANQTAAADTVDFDASLAGTTLVLTQGHLTIDEDLTIDGDVNGDDKADITISGNNASRIFSFSFGSIAGTFQSLNLTDGAAGSGGAIAGGFDTTIRIYDSTLSDNAATGNGGAISVNDAGGGLIIVNSALLNNSAGGDGGAIYSYTTTTITNTTIDGNVAGDDGGAILIGNNRSLTVNNGTISNNAASDKGGGLYIGSGESATLNNTVLAYNTAGFGPGTDIYRNPSGSLAAYNTWATTTFAPTSGANSFVKAQVRLDALADNGGTVVSRNLLFASQLIDAGDNSRIPGGLSEDANGDQRIAGSTVDVGATEFQLVVTTTADSGLDGVGTSLAVDIYDGGGLSLREAINWAAAGDEITFDGTLAGQTIYLDGGELDIAKSLTIDGDVDGDNAADITISGDAFANGLSDSRIFDISGGTVNLNSLTMVDGFATAGGAIRQNGSSTLNIADSTIRYSTATGNGGGIYTGSGTLTITNSLIANNSGLNGGGIFTDGATTINNSTINGNGATNYGGGIGTSFNTDLELNNSTVTNNNAGGLGGGINLYQISNTTTINYSVIAGNSGAGSNDDVAEVNSITNPVLNTDHSFFSSVVSIDADPGAATVTDVGGDPGLGALQDNGETVLTRAVNDTSQLLDIGTDNTQVPGAAKVALVVTQNDDSDTVTDLRTDMTDGGGLSLREAIAHAGAGDTITFDATLKGSKIVLEQGRLGITKDLTIDGDVDGDDRADIIISGNSDSQIFHLSNSSDLTLKSLTIGDGRAMESGEKGGAIYTGSSTTLTLLDSTIYGSYSQYAGGGIYANGAVNIANSLISGNEAFDNGGGVFVTGGSLTVVNSLIDNNNSVNGSGGGLSIESGASATIQNSTIVNNAADTLGGGIYLFSTSTLKITNSILAANSATFGADLGENAEPNTLIAGNTFFGSAVTIDNDLGGNVTSGADLKLGGLLDNGGTVLTRSPLDGSPVIGIGNNLLLRADTLDADSDGVTAELLGIDGRGGSRVVGTVDAGAVEQIVNELIKGNEDFAFAGKSDNLIGGLGNDTLLGGSFDDMLNGGAGNDVLNGGIASDILFGGANNDSLLGDSGNDTLNGGTGADTMKGGANNDLLIVDNAGDRAFGGGGIDRVNASVNHTLANDVENLTLTGAGNIRGTGNFLGNVIAGNGGKNSLFGNGGRDSLLGNNGNDTVNGGTGADTMKGGAGNDLLIVDNAGDKAFGGGGTDKVNASVNHTLANDVENLTLTGTGNIKGTGNFLGNTLTGNGGKNSLFGNGGRDSLLGNAGNDTLNGGTGIDTMKGGAGNDLLIANHTGDKAFGGGGTDKVNASVNHTLANDVENLALTGSANINGTGNFLANVIAGNGGRNALSGNGGNDRLAGNNGNDTLNGGANNDTLLGGNGNDLFNGGNGNDNLFGGAGSNDVATYSGGIGRYQISEISGGRIKVVDTRGGLGTDILSGIEKLKFGATVVKIADIVNAQPPHNARADDDGLIKATGGAGSSPSRPTPVIEDDLLFGPSAGDTPAVNLAEPAGPGTPGPDIPGYDVPDPLWTLTTNVFGEFWL